MPYLLERQIHPVPMANIEKRGMVVGKSLAFEEKKHLLMADGE
jgi:hypothetical protein